MRKRLHKNVLMFSLKLHCVQRYVFLSYEPINCRFFKQSYSGNTKNRLFDNAILSFGNKGCIFCDLFTVYLEQMPYFCYMENNLKTI